MKRTTSLLVILALVIGAVAFWYINKEKEPKKTYTTSDMNFAQNPDVVHKIFMADKEGNTTTLIRKGDEWLIDGKLKVRPTAIAFLLEVIEKIKVKYRPARAAYPTITQNLAVYGIEVELYNDKNELIKNYYVGGTDRKGDGTYMIMADSDEPFVTHLEAHVGGLRTRFAMNGDEWRDRAIYNEKPEDIVAVSVEYPRQKNQSFKLNKAEDGSFNVEPFYNTTPVISASIKKGRVEQYFQGFKSKIAENFQNQFVLKDFAKAVTPFAIVNLKLKDGSESTVRFIPYQKADDAGKPIKPDPNAPVFRYHADCSWGDFMVVQERVFGELFWGYEQFYK